MTEGPLDTHTTNVSSISHLSHFADFTKQGMRFMIKDPVRESSSHDNQHEGTAEVEI